MQFLPSRPVPRLHKNIVLVVLCIALLLLGATLQAGHAHQDGLMHSDCALCTTMHATVAVAASLALFLLLRVVVTLSTRQEEIFEFFEFPFALSNRPPPADLL
jgi:hypothetical protein